VVESYIGYHSCNKMPTVDIPFSFFVTSILDINSNHVTNMYYKVSGFYLFFCRIFVGVLHVLCTCIDSYEYSVPKVTVLLGMQIFFWKFSRFHSALAVNDTQQHDKQKTFNLKLCQLQCSNLLRVP
jgi:hypothetical protein